MKKYFVFGVFVGSLFSGTLMAQKSISVPEVVKKSFTQKFPQASHVIWEKENGNYEANWGGKSNEDNTAMYTPSGTFIEIGRAISVNDLPSSATDYLKKTYKNVSISEASKITDAKGKVTYEAEVKGKDVVFDENGNFVNTEKE